MEDCTLPVSTRREDEDESDGDVVPFQGLLRYERQVPVRQVSYYICGELKEPQYYTELFHAAHGQRNRPDLPAPELARW